MLLQSILYGSLRYWFFTCEPDEALIQRIEADAKQLLWSVNPELDPDELGKQLTAELGLDAGRVEATGMRGGKRKNEER